MVIAVPALKFKHQQATLPVKSSLQRLLLVTNSSVADIVRTYFGETVEAIKLRQKLVVSDSQQFPKLCDREYRLLDHLIVLRGLKTRTNYLYADAQIILEHFEAEIRDELIFSRQPIHELLRKHQFATYRETLDCGIEPAGSLGKHFGLEPTAELIYRNYLIFIDALPTIQISEKFPTTQFLD